MWLAPSKIRFTEKVIEERLENGKTVHDLVTDIESDRASLKDISRLKVVALHGKHYALDNQLLYVFRVLEKRYFLDEVPVEQAQCYDARAFTTDNDGISVVLQSGKEPWKHAIKSDSGPYLRPNDGNIELVPQVSITMEGDASENGSWTLSSYCNLL